MRIIIYLTIVLLSCTKNKCNERAICNDNRLEFGIKCDVCKDVGIKFYFGCENVIYNC